MHLRRVRWDSPRQHRTGLGRCRRGTALLRSRWNVDRQVAPSRAGSQPDVRRSTTESLVRHRYDVAVFDTTERDGGGDAGDAFVMTRSSTRSRSCRSSVMATLATPRRGPAINAPTKPPIAPPKSTPISRTSGGTFTTRLPING